MSSPRTPKTALRVGFTLIEVLVVAAIIALLVAILLPTLRRARGVARQTVCLSNIRSIGQAFSMYRSDYDGWLPVGPANRLAWQGSNPDYPDQVKVFNAPGPHRKPVPWTNCHYGGRRAAVVHHYDPEKLGTQSEPETGRRPLTRYLYKRIGLDSRTPQFECPSDPGVEREIWEHGLSPSKPIHEICGNSYYTNPWGKWSKPGPDGGTRIKDPAIIVLAEDAAFYFDRMAKGRTKGWHDRYSTHNLLFLDSHAEFKFVDTRQHYGPGWYVENYFEIMSFYH